MQVHLARDEIEFAVKSYIRLMFVQAVRISDIKVGGSGQRITAEVEMAGSGLAIIKQEED